MERWRETEWRNIDGSEMKRKGNNGEEKGKTK